MAQEAPTTIHLKDYKPAPYVPGDLFLNFSLEPRATRVISRAGIQGKPCVKGKKCGARSGRRKIKKLHLCSPVKDQAHWREAGWQGAGVVGL